MSAEREKPRKNASALGPLTYLLCIVYLAVFLFIR